MTTVLRVTQAEPLEGHVLRVTFNDGVVREVDCSFLLHGTLGEPLRDLDYFRQARVDAESRTVVWPNGLDPAPELLHASDGPTTGEGPPAALVPATSPIGRLRSPRPVQTTAGEPTNQELLEAERAERL